MYRQLMRINGIAVEIKDTQLITIIYHKGVQLDINVTRGADHNRLYINIPKMNFRLETKNVVLYAFESGLTLF